MEAFFFSTSRLHHRMKQKTVKVVIFLCVSLAANPQIFIERSREKAFNLIDAKKISIIKFALLLVISPAFHENLI